MKQYTCNPRCAGIVIGILCAGEEHSLLRTILIIIVVLALLGSLPTWPYSTGWGYYPSGGLGLILIIVILLILFDRL